MKHLIRFFPIYFSLSFIALQVSAQQLYHEQYRPQVHFSPKNHWMNDPNGLVFNKGKYHLFFQYYPGSSVWGPMHWGHATSKDLVHWEQQPIALYPDSLGYIFSGCAVVDKDNTSGLGKNGQIPLVAVYTNHDPVGEKEKRNNFQYQSIAYSLDNGKTWAKYPGNPVLKNPGITDFRDPSVFWYEPEKKWVMTLATKDRVTFYSSKNLIDWKKESEFGENTEALGGVWECPDLITLDDNGKKVWVLIVSINPGGPNLGSATHYFIGSFNGHSFTAKDTQTKWIDYGPDDYAGITWNNTGNRKIFLGWMSNWMYANLVPTEKWRNAMTVARELQIKHIGNKTYVVSNPVKELNGLEIKPVIIDNLKVNKNFSLKTKTGSVSFPCRIDITLNSIKDLSIELSNDLGEKLVVGFDKKSGQYFIDRTKSGKTDFQPGFSRRNVCPRLTDTSMMHISLLIDVSSVEMFADGGLSVMTAVFFPTKSYNQINISSQNPVLINRLQYAALKSIWR